MKRRERFPEKIVAVALCMALLLPLGAPSAKADEALAALLESAAGRFLLSETDEGSQILSRVLGENSSSADALRNLNSRLDEPGMEDIRSDLRERLQRADELLRERRTESGQDENASSELTAEERVLLREIAARDFRMSGGESGSIDFVDPDAAGSLAGNRARFLEPGPEDPADAPADPNPDPETRARGLRRVKQWLSDMSQCLRERPPSAARSNDLRFMLTGLGISEAFTVGGFVVGSGQKQIDYKGLTSEMLMTAFTTVVGTRLVTGNSKFLLRWIKVASWGVGRATIDGVYYYLTPLKDLHGVPVAQAAEDRYEYDLAWNSATSVIPVGMYYLVSGLECLYPGARTRLITTGLRMSTSAVTSVVYYRLRSKHVDPGHPSH